ncbi:hypothetical protein Syun_001521 [Stephania yunnanensis]|uniref:Uncharacterized protein n=1 Tax=Stephania yunnanensis TaxID=152371 RepID=A0AAP0LEA0_9MAGN
MSRNVLDWQGFAARGRIGGELVGVGVDAHNAETAAAVLVDPYREFQIRS